MSKPSIIITGANGFIGRALVKHYKAKGWRVNAFVFNMPDKIEDNVVYVKYDLSKKPDEGAFENIDYMIHCAFIKNDMDINQDGTKRLIELSRKHEIKKNIFISTLSAHENAISIYGRQKQECERLFNTKRDCIVRAGIVMGDGGLYKQMSEHIRKGKRVPLIYGGKQPMQSIHIDDLCSIFDSIFEKDISGKYIAAEAEAIPYKEFFTEVGKKFNLKTKFINVPFFFLNLALIIAEAIRFKLPVARENVLGLKHMQSYETKRDLETLGVKIKTFKESLALMK